VQRRNVETQSDRAKAPARTPETPVAGRAGSVIALQRMAGNRAVAGLMRDVAGGGSNATPKAQPTPTVLVTIKGHTQGAFKGSARDGAFEAWDYKFKLTGSYDRATGDATGRRSYDPITFVKATDGASPQFMRALVNNEALDTVKIDILSPQRDPSGAARGPTETIVLGGATIVEFEQTTGEQEKGGVDTVRISFKTVQIMNPETARSANDEWRAGR
jgi:type VI secretion system Hcp family effector